nr:hypothetical protein [Mycoplasmopsis bovis]
MKLEEEKKWPKKIAYLTEQQDCIWAKFRNFLGEITELKTKRTN